MLSADPAPNVPPSIFSRQRRHRIAVAFIGTLQAVTALLLPRSSLEKTRHTPREIKGTRTRVLSPNFVRGSHSCHCSHRIDGGPCCAPCCALSSPYFTRRGHGLVFVKSTRANCVVTESNLFRRLVDFDVTTCPWTLGRRIVRCRRLMRRRDDLRLRRPVSGHTSNTFNCWV